MTAAAVLGIGTHRPPRVVGNDELTARLDTSDEWIRRRTGIVTRRIADDVETVVSMAADAGEKALAAAGVDPAQVGLVILATSTLGSPLPGGAAALAHRIGATGAGGFDLGAGCAGFCYALAVAADVVRAGSARLVLVAGAERMSDIVDWDDRASAILFGDGAGAAVVGASPVDGIGPVVWGCDGSAAELIVLPPGGKLRLDGPAVFRWAVTRLGAVAREACHRAGVEPGALAAFVPHQANARIMLALARDLGIPGTRVAWDIADAANTSAASIPLALGGLQERGTLTSGDRALLFGFGAGLTWAGQVITLP